MSSPRMLLSVLVVLASLGSAAAQDTIGNRLAAAERYARVADLDSMITASMQETAKNFPAASQGRVLAHLNRQIDRPRLRNAMLNSMVQVFNVDELNALANFYGSAEGQSVLKKFPQYMGAIMPILQDEMTRAVNAMR
jgi:uncharacterized protein